MKRMPRLCAIPLPFCPPNTTFAPPFMKRVELLDRPKTGGSKGYAKEAMSVKKENPIPPRKKESPAPSVFSINGFRPSQVLICKLSRGDG